MFQISKELENKILRGKLSELLEAEHQMMRERSWSIYFECLEPMGVPTKLKDSLTMEQRWEAMLLSIFWCWATNMNGAESFQVGCMTHRIFEHFFDEDFALIETDSRCEDFREWWTNVRGVFNPKCLGYSTFYGLRDWYIKRAIEVSSRRSEFNIRPRQMQNFAIELILRAANKFHKNDVKVDETMFSALMAHYDVPSEWYSNYMTARWRLEQQSRDA